MYQISEKIYTFAAEIPFDYGINSPCDGKLN